MNSGVTKEKKNIYVIMPFISTKGREEKELTLFFEKHLKEPIEREDSFLYKYAVFRSGEHFDITTKIISDVYTADGTL